MKRHSPRSFVVSRPCPGSPTTASPPHEAASYAAPTIPCLRGARGRLVKVHDTHEDIPGTESAQQAPHALEAVDTLQALPANDGRD